MVKLVIFDVGGTLVEFRSSLNKANVKVLRRQFNVKANEREIKKIVDEIDSKYTNYSYYARNRYSLIIARAVLKRFGIPTKKAKEFVEERDKISDYDYKSVRLFSDAIPAIKKIKNKYLLATIANVHDKVFHQRVLHRTKLKKHFHLHIDSDSVGIRKPNSKIFKIVLNHFNLKPGDSVMIGDTPAADILGAKKLGMHTILINRRRLHYHFIHKTKPDFEITTLNELLPILNKI